MAAHTHIHFVTVQSMSFCPLQDCICLLTLPTDKARPPFLTQTRERAAVVAMAVLAVFGGVWCVNACCSSVCRYGKSTHAHRVNGLSVAMMASQRNFLGPRKGLLHSTQRGGAVGLVLLLSKIIYMAFYLPGTRRSRAHALSIFDFDLGTLATKR